MIRNFTQQTCASILFICGTFLLLGTNSYSQCTITNLNPTYCASDAAFALTGGTNYYGEGVSAGNFDPAVAGPGTHQIVTTDGVASAYNIVTSGTFNRIVAAGTVLPLADDTESGGITIPFTFNFFGIDYTSLRIGSNLVMGFGAAPSVATGANPTLPNAGDPNNFIAAAWGDHGAGGTIQYFVTGVAPFRIFVIDYDAIPQAGGGYTTTSQIQLHETTNVIEIHTANAEFGTNADLASQGIENNDGTIAYPTPGRNNTGWDATNDYVGFFPTCLDIRSVTVESTPTTADAGIDIEQCNNPIFTMAANTPTVGAGMWSLQSGSATITNALVPTTTVTGIAAGTSATVRWTITNGICGNTFEDIVLTNTAPAPIADAGIDIDQCNTATFTMAANAAAPGTGLWTLISGTATIDTPSSATTTVMVAAGSTATLRWTISNGIVCGSTFDEVVLSNFTSPTIADAGIDIEQCNNPIFTMVANTPTVGSGVWSLQSGSATITNALVPTTTVTGIAAGASATVRWTISNGSCGDTFEDIVLTNTAPAPVADAGSDIEQCDTGSFTLSGNAPSPGTGLWTIVGPANGAVITTPTSNTSGVTGLSAGASVALRWTVSNGSVCAATFDEVTLTNTATPSIADAGVDIEQCNTSIFTMAATAPAIGTGAWSVESGTATITNPALATTTITGIVAGSSAIVRWTVNNGSCASTFEDIVLTNTAPAPVADAGSDIEQCDTGSFTLSGNAPSPGIGLWTIVGPANGAVITTPTSNTSGVTGLSAGASVTLRWTINNGSVCAATFDEVTLTNTAPPSIADAGVDIEQCNTSIFTMAANMPTVGTGMWSLQSGSATITNALVPNTTVTGIAAGTSVTVRWTISNGSCGSTFEDIVLTNTAPAPIADAGIDIDQCNTATFTMAANAAAPGTGLWTLISGTATIDTPSSATTTVTVAAGSTATLRWTISNGTVCGSTFDEVVLNNFVGPTIADAGIDIEQCNNPIFTMTANTPTVGSGVWSLQSGTATIINPVVANTTVTGILPGTSATVRWTISNGSCGNTFEDIVLTNTAPAPIANAGIDIDQCNTATFTMAANAAAPGTGLWTLTSGTATIDTPSSAATTVMVAAGSTATLRWTISNGIVCGSTFDEVVLNNFASPTIADAGIDIEQCNNPIFTMAANTPTVGMGVWSLQSGSATITNLTGPNTTVTGIAPGTSATLRWTITNGSCGNTFEDIILTNTTPAPIADAGSFQEQCDDGSFTMDGNDPSPGTGVWTLFSGTATIVTPTSPTTLVTGVPPGTTALLQWTISNGACGTSSEVVALENTELPSIADAGVDIEQCNNSTFIMAAVAPTVGVGQWTLQSGTATISNPGSPFTSVTGVLVGGSATLRWTVANGSCAASFEDIVLTNRPIAPVANAGLDQEKCGDGNFTIAGNPAAPGTGVWTLISGSATITTPGSEVTTVTGVPPGTSATLRWTISNGSVCGSTFDEIVITNYEAPGIADAGVNIEQCNNAIFTMAAIPPVAGSGFWTVQTGSASITNNTLATTTITGVAAGTSVTVRWTVSNGICAATFEDIVLTNNLPGSVADAGVDIQQCNTSTFTMAAVVPAVGTGEWTLQSGSATITDPFSAFTTITGVLPGTSATLRWTVTNGTCPPTFEDILLTNSDIGPSSNAGSDQEKCSNGNFTMAANSAFPDTGTWTLISGAGNITDPTSEVTTITDVPVGTSAVFRWTIVAGATCGSGSTFDDVVLTNSAPPSVADGGVDIEQCNASIFTMAAITPAIGTGVWTVISGSASIGNSTAATTTVSGIDPGTSATLRWTVSNGSCADTFEDIVLTNTAPAPIAHAGLDQEQCNTANFTLSGNAPAPGSGLWTIIGPANGAVVLTPTSNTSVVSGLTAGASVTLRWTISNGSVCASSFDEVTLTNTATPSIADAGVDIEQCNTSIFTMAATAPAIGTGVWSVESGTATITNSTLATTTVTGIAPGSSATLRWTVSNGSCADTFEDIVLANTAPAPLAHAGLDQEQCNTANFTLSGNAPAPGTGLWTIVGAANGAVITTPTSNTSGVTGLLAGSSVTLRWTISNGSVCASSFDEVTLTNTATPSIADAGVDIEQCNTSIFTMAATVPAIGTGMWSVELGTATITNAASATTTITGIAPGSSAILRWTVSNGSCTDTFEDIVLANTAPAPLAHAGLDQEQCNTANFTLSGNAPAPGSGLWTIIGPANGAVITTPTSNTSGVTGLIAGSSVTLRWTISNGSVCASSFDEVTLTNTATPSIADAGVDIEQCNTSIFTMAATVPAIGTGMWSVELGTATITNAASATTTITGIAPGSSATLRWTVGNGSCASTFEDIVLTNTAPAPLAHAGLDQEQCNTANFTLSGNAPAPGTGLWTIVGAANGAVITTPTSNTSGVTGLIAGSSVTLRWTISNGGVCAPTFDEVTLTNTAQPTIADAGVDIEQCDNGTFIMVANVPVDGVGVWTVQSGTATVTNPASPVTTVTGVPAGTTATLLWTISNGSCVDSFDDIMVTNTIAPTVSDAGIDQEICNTGSFLMAANAPTVGTGTWSLVSGTATITDPTSETTTVTGVPAGSSATLRWTISNGTICSPSVDDVVVTNSDLPTLADAGIDIEQCNTSTFIMAANSPLVGTGSWTVESGTATITNPSSPTTTVTGVPVGTSALLRWTITNGSCVPTVSEITVTNTTPATIADAGSNQSICGPFTTLAANTPLVGAGSWTIVSGAGGTVNTPNDPASTFDGVAGTTYTLRWTISNGACSNFDDVQIELKRIPEVAAADASICTGETTNIIISNPNAVAGTVYNWVVLTSTNVSGASPGTGNVIGQLLTSTDGITSGTVVYQITPSANGCFGTLIDVTVTVNPKPVITTPPSSLIAEICSGTPLNFIPTSTIGGTTFTWTSNVIGTLSGVSAGGSGAIADTPVNATNVSAVIIYTVTPSIGTCLGIPVNYVVTVRPVPDAMATGQAICSGQSTSIAITNPNAVVGTVYSWVVQNISNVSGASGGSGNNISQVLTSADGVTTGSVTYRITPSINGCPGNFIDVNVTVNPVPVITNNPTTLIQSTCSGDALNFLPTSTIGGTTYSWTSSIAGSINAGSVTASGSGSITDAPVNIGNSPGAVTYTITPTVGSCSGTPINLVVTIKPRPTVTASQTDFTICSGENASVSLTAGPLNVGGTTFSWMVSATPNVIGAADGNGSNINQVLSTSDANVGTVIYTVTPNSNGCDGLPINITVTVNPVATVDAGLDFSVCEPTTIPISGIMGGSATAGIWTIISGAGSISSSTTVGNVVTATYTVDPADISSVITLLLTTDDPDLGGPCVAASDELKITINRQAIVTAPSDYAVCEPTSINLSGTLGGSATSGAWSILSGNGVLSVSSVTGTVVNANYLPDPSDVSTVVSFRLTTNDPDGAGPCVEVYDDVDITINESPKVFAGNDFEVCEDQVVNLNGSFSGSTTTVTWSGGSGAAQFGSIGNPITTYILTAADIAAGFITLTLTTDDPDGGGPCATVSDQVIITINKLPAVGLANLAPSYAENDPPVTMVGFPSGGSGVFTGPGVIAGTNIFDPGTANIGPNLVTYTYTDVKGCTNSDSKIVNINELTSITFSIFNGVNYVDPSEGICAEIGFARLKGEPPHSTGQTPTFFACPTNPGIIGFDGLEYYVNTDGLASGTYFIEYTYTNSSLATSTLIKALRVNGAPVAGIDANDNCEDSPVAFTDTSSIPDNYFNSDITAWSWNFGDGSPVVSQRDTTYSYANAGPGTYLVTHRVVTDAGCFSDATQTIVIGSAPIVDFTWDKICGDQPTEFMQQASVTSGTINSYAWDFGDGDILSAGTGSIPVANSGRTTGTYENPHHQFVDFGERQVQLTISTSEGCTSSFSQRVYTLDQIDVTNAQSYSEDFSTGKGSWFEDNSIPSSWVFGPPDGNKINSPENVWWTGINPTAVDDYSTYFKNENSSVLGPCVDLTSVDRPMISIDYWTDTPNRDDGAVLQYSRDGNNWIDIGDAEGAGINWYNGKFLSSSPGGQRTFAWTDTLNGWKTARYKLDDIPIADRNQVLFRIAFGSNADNLPGRVLNGFAFDNIYIGNKQRNVLVESFVNASQPASDVANDYLNGLYDNQFLAKDSSDFFKIEYHVAQPGFDSLNYYNPTDPSGRGLSYGIVHPPAAIMDGILGDFYGKTFTGNYLTITDEELDRRALESPSFDIIVLDTIATNNNTIRVHMEVQYIDSINTTFTNPVTFQIALVDSIVQIGGVGTEYKNVVRKLLLNTEGLTVSRTWALGDIYDAIDVDRIIDFPISNPDYVKLVAFVQDNVTRQILQSKVIKGPPKTGAKPVGVDDGSVLAELNNIMVYPNPAKNKFYFGFEGGLSRDYSYSIIDQRGVTVLRGSINRDRDIDQEVDVTSLANGIYFVAIGSSEKALVYKKIAIMNRN